MGADTIKHPSTSARQLPMVPMLDLTSKEFPQRVMAPRNERITDPNAKVLQNSYRPTVAVGDEVADREETVPLDNKIAVAIGNQTHGAAQNDVEHQGAAQNDVEHQGNAEGDKAAGDSSPSRNGHPKTRETCANKSACDVLVAETPSCNG